MYIKFLPHSTGGGADAIDYLLGARDHKGAVRAGVEVLRGDPYLSGQLIDSLDTVHRYSSAVIAWERDDKPTRKQIEEAIEGFRRTAFAGLNPEQYNLCAVRHDDADGSVHIHIIVPLVELTSGLAMNVAPPGWEFWVGPLRNSLNYKYGWARPDDPRRSRNLQKPSSQAPSSAQDRKEKIVEALIELVRVEAVTTRADVVQALSRYGEITREGKDYVSVKEPGSPKALRFKGLLFVDGKLDAAALLAAAKRTDESETIPRDEPDRRAAAAEARVLRTRIAARAAFNRECYKPKPPKPRAVRRAAAKADEPTAPSEIVDVLPDSVILAAVEEEAAPAIAFATDRARAAVAREAQGAVDDLLAAARAAFDRTRDAVRRVSEEIQRAGRALAQALGAVDRLGEAVAAGQVVAASASIADPLARMRAALDRLPARAAPSLAETPPAKPPRPPGRRP